jgi:prophage tail gpP-like protein
MAFKPQEVAVLIVNGVYYRDWESVMVKLDFYEQAFARFRFTCSEGMPLAKNFAKLRIKPGDHVDVSLAGIKVIVDGIVYSRQVSYSARAHHIEIQGVSQSHKLTQGSVVHKTGEWKNASFQQIARSVMGSPFNVALRVIGSLPTEPFDRVHLQFGETPMQLIERLARARNIVLGSDGKPGLLATTNPGGGVQGQVIEGVNILEGRELWTYYAADKDVVAALSQKPGGDKVSMTGAAHELFQKTNALSFGGGLGQALTKLTAAEVPSGIPDLRNRNDQENSKGLTERIELFITVQGWLRPDGGLWNVPSPDGTGADVYVRSPMLIMDQVLHTKSVTFTQDNSTGTRTTLELVNILGTPQSLQEPSGAGAETTST